MQVTRHDMLWRLVQLVEQPLSEQVLLSDVTVRLPVCAQLWSLMANECTFSNSAVWPSPGLQAGRAFLYYLSLAADGLAAVRVNVTCDGDEWDALVANNTGADGIGGAGLAPCATAIVTTGQELLDQLAQLQLTASRVLITVAANVSLPTAPTPQRQDPAPDDSMPLVRIYRNVTLAGGASLQYLAGHGWSVVNPDRNSTGTAANLVELDSRLRRNAFDMTAGRQRQQLQQAVGAGGAYPILVLADLGLVNVPPGPLSSWPLGLLPAFLHFVGVDRRGSGGAQIIVVRTVRICRVAEFGYMAYWYGRLVSLEPSEGKNAAWLQSIRQAPAYVADEDGGQASVTRIMDYILTYNCSVSPRPLLTTPSPTDFDLWSLEPPEPPAAPSPPLPPSSFTVAMNATQLLGLMQEAWSGVTPRVILLLANIRLRSEGQWPQAGARLTYNVTLLGPVTGPPVWLDTGGLPLVDATAAATVGNSSGSANNNNGSLTVQLHRVQLLGYSPPLMVADPELVTAVAAAAEEAHLVGSPQLLAWADRCISQHRQSNGGSRAAASYELRNCSLGLRPAIMGALWLSTSEAACTSGRSITEATAGDSSGTPAWAPNLCALLGANYHSTDTRKRLAELVKSVLGITGQVTLVSGNATRATRILVPSASLEGVKFISASIYSQGGEASAVLAASATANVNITTADDTPCGVEALLAAMATVPLASFSSVEAPAAVRHQTRSTSPAVVVVGAAVGAGTGGVALLLAAVALLLVWRRRQRRRAGCEGHLYAVMPPEVLVVKKGREACGDAAGDLAGRDSGAGPSQGQRDPTLGPGTGGGEGGGGSGSATAVAAAPNSEESPFGGSGLTLSDIPREEEGDTAASGNQGGGRAATMADAFQLLGAGGGGAAGATGKVPLGPVAAAAQSLGLRPQPSAGKVQPRTGGMLESIQEDIQELMRRCQLVTVAAACDVAAGDSGNGRRRMKMLGRGAFGAVYLGEWRGLPAAIKVVVLGPGSSSGRQERLAREVALTMTLSHPHIVPTYNHTVTPMATGLAGGAARWPGGAGAPPGGHGPVCAHGLDPDSHDDEDNVTALELRLVMQYCEGGTLGGNLFQGRFRTELDVSWTEATATSTSSVPLGANPALAQAGARELAATAACGADPCMAACVQHGRLQQQQQQQQQDPTAPHQPAAPEAVDAAGQGIRTIDVRRGGYLGSSPPLSWSDMKPAANLLLSLLAALDVARGLEYLHACAVIHGDLTENNVLLKAVAPVLPPPPLQQPPAQLPGRGSSSCGPCSPGAGAAACVSTTGLLDALASITESTGGPSGPLAAGHGNSGLLVGNSAASDDGREVVKDGDSVHVLRAASVVTRPARLGSREARVAEGSGEERDQVPGGAEVVAVAADGVLPAGNECDSSPAATHPTLMCWQQEQRISGGQPVVASTPEERDGTCSPARRGEGCNGGITTQARGDGWGDTRSSPAATGVGAPWPPTAPSGWPSKASVAAPNAAALAQRVLGYLEATPRLPRLFDPVLNGSSQRLATMMSAGGSRTNPLLKRPAFAHMPASYSEADMVARTSSVGDTLPPSHRAALQLLRWSFKISDFGLSVQIHDPAQSHLSNMAQGTPFFVAPEVTLQGRLSPAADVYSFGVLLWLLLHGVSIRQIRHLLPAVPHLPVGSLLLRHASPALLPTARELLLSCLDDQPQRRPGAGQLREALEALLRDVAGAELSQLLLGAERREHLGPGDLNPSCGGSTWGRGP